MEKGTGGSVSRRGVSSLLGVIVGALSLPLPLFLASCILDDRLGVGCVIVMVGGAGGIRERAVAGPGVALRRLGVGVGMRLGSPLSKSGFSRSGDGGLKTG